MRAVHQSYNQRLTRVSSLEEQVHRHGQDHYASATTKIGRAVHPSYLVKFSCILVGGRHSKLSPFINPKLPHMLTRACARWRYRALWRQVRRLVRRYEQQGPIGLISRRRDRPVVGSKEEHHRYLARWSSYLSPRRRKALGSWPTKIAPIWSASATCHASFSPIRRTARRWINAALSACARWIPCHE